MMQHQVTLAPAAGARVELRCLVFSLTVYVPHRNTGGDWPGVTLSRRTVLMSSRLVLIRAAHPQRNQRTELGAGEGLLW